MLPTLIKIISAIAILGFTSLGMSSNAFGSDAWQVNTQLSIKARTLGWNNNMYFAAERSDVWNNDETLDEKNNDHVYEHWQGIIGDVTHNNLFDYGVGYQYIRADHSDEHRPHIFVTPQGTFLGDRLHLSASNKLEYRIREANDDGFQYKIKPMISYDIPATDDISVHPYVYDEVAYNAIKGDWGNNEVGTGAKVLVNNHYYVTPFYKYVHDIHSGDKTTSLWGMNVGASF